MTESAVSPTPPALVDVAAAPGCRVRDQQGALLPEGHILRGVPRSAFWLRLERDGDVALTAHQPDAVAAPVADGQPPADLPALQLASGERGRKS
jgi:hypothetical protein